MRFFSEDGCFMPGQVRRNTPVWGEGWRPGCSGSLGPDG